MVRPEVLATVRLVNDEDDGIQNVPADILARSLVGVQQLVYLLASVQEQRTIKSRFRPSQEIQQRYVLKCQVPQSGSYTIPMMLGGDVDDTLFTNFAEVLGTVMTLLTTIDDGGLDGLVDVLPDSKIRNRALREVRKLLPKPGDGWRFGFQVGDEPGVLMSSDRAIATIDKALNQDSPEDTIMTVTGELIRIDFDKRTIVLRYPPTSTEIECVYVDDVEETMIESRRELVQATGRFTLDQEGNPAKLVDVTQLEPVDLSPIAVKSFGWDDRTFRLMQPLVLYPQLDEDSSQLYVVEEPDITLLAYAQTREQLWREIDEQLACMWEEYVQCDPDELAPDAIQLRKRLLAMVEE